MQDIHSMGSGGGSGRLFGNLGDRRLRPHSHHLNHQQTLKCPRCDSLNTKFCYYNNYNLSQPRHFCKGCRRYWTKGGVLRNVPVGGGCRKAKRSSKTKQNPSDDAPADAAPPPPPHKSNSNSSSDSSSLTATAVATEAVSGGGGGSSNSAPDLFNFHNNSKLFVSQAVNPSFNPPLMDHQSNDVGSIFPEIGVFTGMMTSSNDPSPLGFNMADISSYRLENQEQFVENRSSDQQMMTNTAGYLDQTGEIELSGLQSRTSNGGLAGVDWQQADGGDQDQDQGMFDLTGTVDQGYWSQTQWPDHSNHSLHYLP